MSKPRTIAVIIFCVILCSGVACFFVPAGKHPVQQPAPFALVGPHFVTGRPVSLDTLMQRMAPLSAPQQVEIERAVALGSYLPDDTLCAGVFPLKPVRPRIHRESLYRSLHAPDETQALLALNAFLYTLIPEERDALNGEYDPNTLSFADLYDSLALGSWKMMCAGHARVAEKIIPQWGAGKFHAVTGELNQDSGHCITHTLILVYFQKNGTWYGTTFDCQNGVLGPLKNTGAVPSLEELRTEEACFSGNYKLLFLPDSVLQKKRVLTNEAMPCNLFPHPAQAYYRAHPKSGYRWEHISYSQLYYSLFKTGGIDSKKYMHELTELLVSKAPR